MSNTSILVVDDEQQTLDIICDDVNGWGYSCFRANSGKEALDLLNDNDIDLIVSDHKMPGMDGLELLREVKTKYSDIPFVILSAFATIDKAVLSIKHGADDYLQKPYEPEELQNVVVRSLGYKKLTEENENLKDQLRSQFSFESIVSSSQKMENVLALAEKVATSPDTTVAIYGESGTGKEVLARAIHVASCRSGYKFVAINCAGIPSNLLESELFGHVKGAFTGAEKSREGKFTLAKKGTILLDEIGDMPIDLQAKLLRVLQERTYEMVGSNKTIEADFRVIVSTNKDLQDMVRKGAFREDLFHRINPFPIKLPPLRDRKEDISVLANHFLEEFRCKLAKHLTVIAENTMDVLEGYSWPGNIRELKNCIERATILVDEEIIQPKHLIIKNLESYEKKNLFNNNGQIYLNITIPEDEFSLERISDHILKLALEKFDNNKSNAAEYLKVNRSVFYSPKKSKSL